MEKLGLQVNASRTQAENLSALVSPDNAAQEPGHSGDPLEGKADPLPPKSTLGSYLLNHGLCPTIGLDIADTCTVF